MPYVDNVPHAGSAEILFTGLYDEPAGTIARTFHRGLVSSGLLAALSTTGTVVARLIGLPAGMVITNMAVQIGGTGATGPTHFWLGLSDIQVNVLAVTADQGAGAQTANSTLKVPLTSPYQVPYTGSFYLLASSSASTTAPTMAGISLGANAGNTAPVLAGTAGIQAAPPAVGTQLNGGVITSNGNGNIIAWLS